MKIFQFLWIVQKIWENTTKSSPSWERVIWDMQLWGMIELNKLREKEIAS